MNSLQFKMRKSFVLLMSLLLVFSMFIPAVEANAYSSDKESEDLATVVEVADHDESLHEVQEVDKKVSISEDRSTEVKEKIEQALEKSKQYYKDIQPSGAISHSDYWLFSALWGADINLKEFPWAENGSPWEKDTFWTKGKESVTSTSNEDAGIIIGSILLGQDPEKFGQRNIVQDLIAKQKDDGSFFTIWGEPWAMIALDLVDADYDREKHIAYMLGKQSNGTFGGVDSNGWILTALAPYKDERQDVKEAIELAVQTVHEGYREKGDIFDSWGANSNSTAAALMGLAAVGEDLLSSKWTKDGRNLVEQFIETYQQEDGSFWWQENMAGAVSMATEQSLLALATVMQGESIFVLLKEQGKDVEQQATEVSLRVEGIKDTLYLEDKLQVVTSIAEATAFDVTEQGLNQASIPFEGSTSFISKIGDEDTATFGGWDGWQYMVNDAYPSDSVGDYIVKDGDEVVWFYGNVGDIYKGEPSADEVEKLTLNPKITVASELYAGDEIEVSVTAKYDIYNESFELEEENVEAPIKNADIYFNGETYKADENGNVRIPGEKAKVGEYEIRVTKDIENSYPRLLRQAKKIIIEERPSSGGGGSTNPSTKKVTLSVEKRSINEGDIIGPTEVTLQSGDTAFTLMKRIVEQRKISLNYTGSDASLYVQAIDGLGEFDKGSESGWMYSVNGTFPDYSAGKYNLKDGDVLRWRYTTDLGNDIGAIIPDGGSSGGDGGSSITPTPEVAEISVPSDKPFTLESKFQKELTNLVVLNFGKKNKTLPKITAPRENTLLEIAQGTKITSEWNGKLQVPTSVKSTEKDLANINKVLSSEGKEIDKTDLHVKVGGEKAIQFDRHVTLTFKGKVGYEVGLIDVDGKFLPIKQEPTAESIADVYAYVNGNDLIIKTNHFTEFLTFKSKEVEQPEVPETPTEPTEPEEPKEFTDITNHWAKDFIQQAAQLEIIKGYADGSFKPDNNLTRAQAVSVLVRALDLKSDQSAPFKDIGSYAKETQAEIAAAYKYGLVTKQDGNFNPAKNVTRAQMALMLQRAYESKTDKKYIASEKAPYTDFGSYNEETVNAISMLYELGIATGSDGKYMPSNSTTRAHVAKMLINFLDEIE